MLRVTVGCKDESIHSSERLDVTLKWLSSSAVSTRKRTRSLVSDIRSAAHR